MPFIHLLISALAIALQLSTSSVLAAPPAPPASAPTPPDAAPAEEQTPTRVVHVAFGLSQLFATDVSGQLEFRLLDTLWLGVVGASETHASERLGDVEGWSLGMRTRWTPSATNGWLSLLGDARWVDLGGEDNLGVRAEGSGVRAAAMMTLRVMSDAGFTLDVDVGGQLQLLSVTTQCCGVPAETSWQWSWGPRLSIWLGWSF